MSFVYLGAPYSHKNPHIRTLRYQMTNEVAARLMQQGMTVFSPISHSHEVSKYLEPENDTHELWMRQDLPILERAAKLIVLRLNGWDKSRGLAEEIEHAKVHGIPIEMMDY